MSDSSDDESTGVRGVGNGSGGAGSFGGASGRYAGGSGGRGASSNGAGTSGSSSTEYVKPTLLRLTMGIAQPDAKAPHFVSNHMAADLTLGQVHKVGCCQSWTVRCFRLGDDRNVRLVVLRHRWCTRK